MRTQGRAAGTEIEINTKLKMTNTQNIISKKNENMGNSIC
jgi:hypothetical protein